MQRPLESLQVQQFFTDLPRSVALAQRNVEWQEMDRLRLTRGTYGEVKALVGHHILNVTPGQSLFCCLPRDDSFGYRLLPQTLGESEIPHPKNGYDTGVCIPNGQPIFRTDEELRIFFEKVGRAMKVGGRLILPQGGLRELFLSRMELQRCLGPDVELDAPGQELMMETPASIAAQLERIHR